MSTFKRYLCTFLAIGAIIFIFGLILIIKDRKLFNLKFISFFVLAIVIYVFPMSLFCSKRASLEEIRINKTSVNIIEEIDVISSRDCNRKIKTCNDNVIIYSMDDKFSAWLTNPIEVTDYGEYLIINVPKAYSKYFKSLL